MIKIGIVGGTGYGAVELLRILTQHPHVDEINIYSNSKAGDKISDSYPHLDAIANIEMKTLSVAEAKTNDVLFFATPPGVSHQWIPKLYGTGVKLIDLSGDFRLLDREVYASWYKQATTEKEWLEKAVYGLSEVYTEAISEAEIVANPGCYPTATLLGLLPAIEGKIIDPSSIIVDGKTGVSGAGRSVSLNTHYAEMNENFKVYQVGTHKHTPEIERFLSDKAEADVVISFTPHIVPMTRGIMTTSYTQIMTNHTEQEIEDFYRAYYEHQPFVRIRTNGNLPQTKEVYGSNYCDISITVDQRTGRLIIIAVIDNLMKGAAGQAVQNMNIINGWDQTTGLSFIPTYP
ncbi:N-acetyl-gamma-glutamyl-phosphate reductase [Streptohalobacillus salinus]|uniref:N-acetyl-gamma-glutamyl-phosphate reductase n=1 Tax=Streptohalobacillus salinus TaxID=621096 RepID=A0A2V3WEZ5_9BACI|nr:N-acetyl-gamma-glutamyl-phosphate reductase [Streptohalobacillus salinus]